jgi:two-component system, OmpR family, phosphate regulon sensor histidine kinase PhoR
VRPLKSRLLSVRRSLPLFLVIVVCLAFWQVWLTWRLMEQDRSLAAQRSRERLEQIADLGLAQLASVLAEWDLSLREMDALPPSAALKTGFPLNATLILLASPSVNATYPSRPLLFVAEPPAAGPLPVGFDTADRTEFREQNYHRALEALRPLAEKPATRAEALLRIARLQRKLSHPEAALGAYDRMCGQTAVSPDGVPYTLLAAAARCDLLAGQDGAVKEAERLRGDLSAGRWPLHRETFEYFWGEVNRLLHEARDPPKHSVEFSSLVSRLHHTWRQAVGAGSSFNGRETQPDGSLLIWRAAPLRLTALVAPAGWLGASLKLPVNASDIRWRLSAPGLQGSDPPANAGHVARRSLAEAQLAGGLEFYSISALTYPGHNRVVWLAAVALMLVLVLAGAYAMHRGVSRELRLAQLQSDFVSAVSHEFRSPLTSLRGIAELLANDRIADEGRRRQSYVFLERETGRLQRMVEDLLDFGRMESGWKQYRIEPHDVFGLVRAAVVEFREEALPAGFQVEMSLDACAAPIEADEGAMRRAIRNLLENAVKYSPECRTVWVEGRVNHRKVAISVRDRGMGIEAREQGDIFQKFVRGDAAKKAGIKGTGIGLSMVRQIVEACGGEIRLESAEGAGSTFTILLPLARPAVAGAEETRA